MIVETLFNGGQPINIQYQTPAERAWLMQYLIETMQATNLVKNPGFELGTTAGPSNWYKYQSGTTAVLTYPEPGRVGGSSVSIDYAAVEAGKSAGWTQTITVMPSTVYNISAYATSQNIAGTGAQILVNWYNSSNTFLSQSVITNITGTTPWTNYQSSVTSPPTATRADFVLLLKNSSGKVWFDDTSLVSTAPPAATYNCTTTGCVQAPAGTTGQYTDLASCQGACQQPPPGGTGISTNVILGGIAAVAVVAVIIMAMKKK